MRNGLLFISLVWLSVTALGEPLPLTQSKEESELAGSVLELAIPTYEEEQIFHPSDLAVGSVGEDLSRTIPPGPRWRVAPHLYLRATYDDNIFIQPKDRQEDLIFTLAPGVAMGWWSDAVTVENYVERQSRASRLETAAGDYLYLDYTTVGRAFTDNTGESSVGHEAFLSGAWEAVSSKFGSELAFSSGTVTDEDIGTLVDRQLFSAVVDGRWDLTAKTAYKPALRFKHAEYDDFYSESEWRLDQFVSWKCSPLLGFEPGIALGYLDAGSKDEQRYTQLLLRIHYKRAGKLSYEGAFGVEMRESKNYSDRTTPVGRVLAFYDVRPKTRLVLQGFQQVASSAAEDLGTYRISGVSLGVEQGLMAGALLSLASGYEWARYDKGGDGPRRDGYFFANARLIYNFTRWLNAGVALQHRRNDSNDASYDYRSNQVSVEASLLY